MARFVLGAMKFQKEVFPEKQEMFERLAAGQSPEALFITCADSRIETGLITQSDPGDIFVCRNAGNIVPPHTNQAGGMTASIEFAVSALRVPNIVVCGHTECGAMKGAMNLDGLGGLPQVREWLNYSKAAVDVVESTSAGLSDAEKMERLLRQNVILQMQHLKTHPTVAAALAQGSVELHGWVYDIKTGAVDAYDEAANDWKPLDARYTEEASQAEAALAM